MGLFRSAIAFLGCLSDRVGDDGCCFVGGHGKKFSSSEPSLRLPDPVVIPDAAGFGYPEIDFAYDTDSTNIIQKDQDLTGEQGLLWFWHHCHYSIKWRIIYSGLPLLGIAFFLGWKANKYSFFQKVGSALHEVVYGEESAHDKDDSPKKAPSQP